MRSTENLPRTRHGRKRESAIVHARATRDDRDWKFISLSYLSAFEMKRHDIAGEYPRAHSNRNAKKNPSRPRVAVASSYLSTRKVPHVPNNFPLVISQPKFLRLLVVFDDYSRRVADARSGDDGRRARRLRVLRISDGKRAQRRAARGWLKRKHVRLLLRQKCVDV